MRSLGIILFLIASNLCGHSQIGYYGKRFIVNGHLINGIKRPLSGIGVEYALARNISIAANFFGTSSSGVYNLEDSYKIENWVSTADFGDLSPNFFIPTSSFTIKKGTFLGMTQGLKSVSSGKYKKTIRGADLSLRFYYNSFRSAPYGNYLILGIRYSQQHFSGGFYYPDSLRRYIYVDNYDDTPKSLTRFYKESYQEIDTKYTIIEPFIGFGRQILIGRRFSLDLSSNFGLGYSKKADPLSNDLVVRSTLFKNNPNTENFSGNVISLLNVREKSRTAFSFSIFVKVGYLLY